jgi:hypothetical protein
MNSLNKSLHKNIVEFISAKKCTLLAIGPVSVNCVDAAIEISSEFMIPMILIASRRQVDSAEHGGGYVNNWTTEKFAEYVKRKDTDGRIILARDHGGPWQNSVEIDRKLSLRKAMESAKSSYRADIDAGFRILHIDPSIDIHGQPAISDILERIFELYAYCAAYAAGKGKDIIFEIGTEEPTGGLDTISGIGKLIDETRAFCNENRLRLPSFVVIQGGTKVMEMQNVGILEKSIRNNHTPVEIMRQIPEIVEYCKRSELLVKVHNGDYLSDQAIRLHPAMGIHAANVAPEFGVTETRKFISVLEENGLKSQTEKFLELSYNSGKWKKWMMDDTKTTERDRAIISGHYVFSNPEFRQLKEDVAKKLNMKTQNLDKILRNRIKKQMIRYLHGFGLAP